MSARLVKARKARKCGRCGRVIAVGELYHSWSFFREASKGNCAEHPPKQSELTAGKLSAAYAAQEDAADAVDDWGKADKDDPFVLGSGDSLEERVDSSPNLPDVDELRGILETAADAIREVAQEYTDAADSLSNAFQGGSPQIDELTEKADYVEAAADSLGDVEFEGLADWSASNADEAEAWDPSEDDDGLALPDERSDEEKREADAVLIREWIEAQQAIAQEALDALDFGI